jgi:hypothetical protein
MAGTLTVQNLQGPSSGANANKIIVPSGQTIDASAGTLVPSAGHTVQTVWSPVAASFDTTTNAYITQASVTFTPKFTGSRVIVEWSGHVYKYNSTTDGNSPARLIYDGYQLWQNNYLTYTGSSASHHMFTGFVRGQISSTGTSPVVISFDISAGFQGHQYVYGGTGGLLIKEIKQ